MSTPSTPLKKIDLTESVAGEEDPGASIDPVANVPAHAPAKPVGPQAPGSGMEEPAKDRAEPGGSA